MEKLQMNRNDNKDYIPTADQRNAWLESTVFFSLKEKRKTLFNPVVFLCFDPSHPIL